MKDLLGRLVSKLESVAPYADAIYIENQTRTYAKDNTGIEVQAEADAGVKIRAFDGQRFHEVCVQGWQPQALQAEAQRLAAYLKDHQHKGIALKVSKEQIEKDFSVTHAKDPAAVPVKQKTDTLTRIYEQVRSFSKEFVNCRVTYREERERRVFVNRYKRLAADWTGCTLSIVPFVQTQDGQARHDYASYFSNGFEVTDIASDELERFLRRAVRVKDATRIAPGAYTAILAPGVTGLLAHESFGHGMESDVLAQGRAKAEEYLGKKIAGAKVSICDDPSLPGTHGFLFFDDEGVLPKRTFLVDKGVVTSPITESLSASRRNLARTANGRAESFDRKVYARMTNTFFLPGKDDVEAMIKGVRNGIYIHSGTSGMEDPKGWGVQIAGLLCERIKNGKLTGELYYEATIGGYLPAILNNIKAVGKDFEIAKDAGFCGKGHKEWVRVSSGGPHLLIEGLQLT